jgi:hypothetical protein
MRVHTPHLLVPFTSTFTLLIITIVMASTFTTSTSITIGQTFSSLAVAKAAIKQAISERHESYIVDYSDKNRFRVICQLKSNCDFQVRAINSKRNRVMITHTKPHSCSPAIHFDARNTHSLQFLLPCYRALVLDNPKISIKQI